MQEKEKDKYQGWTNYETWTVSLWLNNDEASHHHWRQSALHHERETLHSDDVAAGICTPNEAARFSLADQLQEEIADAFPLADASMFSDLLDAALSEVNWHEIAQSLLDDVNEDDPPPKIFLAKSDEQTPTFSMGSVCSTPAALEVLSSVEIATALARHAQGDWGDVCDEDRQSNREALREGFRLFSVYHSEDGIKFWIITEADRSVTTVLLPSDY